VRAPWRKQVAQAAQHRKRVKKERTEVSVLDPEAVLVAEGLAVMDADCGGRGRQRGKPECAV